MATFTKIILSGSTSGTGIKLTDTGTSGNTDAGYLIHEAVAGSSDIDEVYLYATNSNAAAKKVTIEWGGVTAIDHTIEITVPGESGLTLIAPGLLLNGGLLIKAFCETADVVAIYGYVNRITA